MVGRWAAFRVVLVICIVIGPWGAKADSDQLMKDAELFVGSLTERAISQLTDAEVPPDEQELRFRKIIREFIAFKSIARWVLGGRYWRQATEVQRTRYLGLFEDMMVATYAHRFQSYAGETLEVDNVRLIGDDQVLVRTELTRPGADKALGVDWRVRRTGESFRVIDISVEGLSMAQTQRSEFKSLLRSNGGDLDGLFVSIEDRLRKARADRAQQQSADNSG